MSVFPNDEPGAAVLARVHAISARTVDDDAVSCPGDPDGSADVALLHRIELIAQEVNAGGDVVAILQGIANAVTRYSPWPMCWVGLIDVDDRALISYFHAGFDPAVSYDFGDWPTEGAPSLAAASAGKIVTIPNVSEAHQFPFTRREAIRAGYRSAAYVPVPVDKRWAVLNLCLPEPHQFTTAELSLASIIASFAGIAFRNVVAKAREVEAEKEARTHLAALNGAVVERNNMLQRLSSAQDRLLSLQINGSSLPELCRAISVLLDASVLLLDRFQQPLATSRLDMGEAAELAAYVTDRTPVGDAGRGVVYHHDASRHVAVRHAHDGPNRVASLLASLVVAWPSDFVPDAASAQIIELASVHVSLGVLKQRAAIEAEVRLRQDFGEALDSLDTTGLALSQRAAVLGIELEAKHRVMRVRAGGLERPLAPHDAFEIANLLSRKLTQSQNDSVVTPVDGVDFVVVLTQEQPQGTTAAPIKVVRAALHDALQALRGPGASPVSIAVGIGDTATGVEGLRRSHREAQRALDVALLVEGGDAERTIAEVGSYAVLTAASGTDQDIFLGRYLAPLLEYDRQHNAGYVETLEAYFETVGNVQRTADKLFLHLSTVRYRLKRIGDIASVDLRQEEDRLCMQLALRLGRLAGRPSPTLGS